MEEKRTAAHRDRSIDVGRGLLVILMVYAHMLQFFADAQIFPLAGRLIEAANLTVFPTFVFYFGVTAVLAYLGKPYRRALPGMAKTALRAYGAFVLSGVGFRVLRENVTFGPGTVRRVLQLKDIPGWSEFLIAFAGYALVLMVLFQLLRRMADKPLWALGAGALCLLGTVVIPYSRVESVHLALFIGGRQFSYFPVLQYMPYFLAGMVYARGSKGVRLALLGMAVLGTAAGGIYTAMAGLPGRFPPSLAWVVFSGLNVAAVVLAGRGLCMAAGSGWRMAFEAICRMLAHLGSRSLYYLLGSNLVIFTLAGKNIVPMISRKSVLPWTLPIQSTQGAAWWTVVLFIALWFVALLAGRGGKAAKV